MKQLETNFQGKGEVIGYMFQQMQSSPYAYIYKVINIEDDNNNHYEVFIHRENTQFNNVSYPKANSFGVWAWTFKRWSDAFNKYNELIIQGEEKLKENEN